MEETKSVTSKDELLSTSFHAICTEVLDLLRLPPNWDSYSAARITPRNVAATIKLLADFLDSDTPPPEVVPRVQGNIQVEWHMNGIEIEIYIDSPNRISYFAEDIVSNESVEWPLSGHEDELRMWISRLSSSNEF